jgi:flagellar protein FlaF
MNGYAAYGRVQNITESPRAIEARLLTQATVALRTARENPTDKAQMYDALIWNMKIWDAFMVDLADDNNRLPKDLRKSLINVAAWVSRHTFKVMDGQGKVDALITVNTNIIDGLK